MSVKEQRLRSVLTRVVPRFCCVTTSMSTLFCQACVLRGAGIRSIFGLRVGQQKLDFAEG